MKKGLLSLLAVALTIVSCQNYDDQFAELTGLVNTLSTEVSGLSQVKTDIGSVKATVDGLVTSISSIPTTDNSATLTTLLSGLEQAQLDIAAVNLLITNLPASATASDVQAIDDLVDAVQASVNQLLTKNANITANIVINNTATLAGASDYIELGTTSPAGYLLNGSLNVDHTSLTADEIVSANELTAKIISVSAGVTVNGLVDLSGLSYIGGTYEIKGATRPNDSTVSSLGGNFILSGKLGDLTFPSIVSILGNVTVDATTVASVTSIDLSSVATIAAGKKFQGGTSLAFTNLLSANFGKFPMEVVSNPKLVTLVLGQTAVAAALTITAPKATAIDGSMTSAAALITIVSAASTSVIHFDSLATAAGGITHTAALARVSEFHLPGLTKIEGADVILNAQTLNLAGLTKMVGNTLTIQNVWYLVDMPLFVATNAAITFNGANAPAHLNFPNLVLGALLTTVASTTQLTVASTGDATFANARIVAGNTTLTTLNITAATVNIAPITADLANLDHLNISGKTGTTAGTNFSVDLSTAANQLPALLSLTVGNFKAVTVTAATLLVTITTTGGIDDLTIATNPALKTVSIGHGPNVYTAYPAQSVTITGNVNAGFKSVDLGSVVLLDAATITGNTALSTITAPAVTGTLLPNAVVDLTVKGNSLVATGTTEVPGTLYAQVVQPSLTTWKAYVLHVQTTIATTDALIDAGAGPLSFDFDYEKEGDLTAGNFVSDYGAGAAGALGGTMDLVVELNYVDRVQPTP